MALINNYVDTNILAGKVENAALVSGVQKFTAIQSFAVALADSAASIYRVFKGIPSDAIITSLELWNDAVAGGNAATIGLYDVLDFDGVGAVISATLFCASIDLSSAHAMTGAMSNGITAVAIANREKQLWELAGQTQYPYTSTGPKAPAYDIAIALPNKVADTGSGNVFVKLSYIRGV